MSTRHAQSGSGRRQQGFASDPIYAAALGIQGTIATKKAGILANARARSLVFFLQALSLPELAGPPNRGGLKRWARQFLDAFPERIGSPAMHKFGMKPGQSYKADQVREVRAEICTLINRGENENSFYDEPQFPVIGDTIFDPMEGREVPMPGALSCYPAEVFKDKCRKRAEREIEAFLIGLCSDPKLLVVAPGETEEGAALDAEDIAQFWPEASQTFAAHAASVPWFRDILGALFEFQQRVAAQHGDSFAMTSIARRVFETLDAGLRLRRIVLIDGLEGVGKSEAAKAWCAQHLGEARYVDLQGIINRTNFFRTLARALGLPSSESLNVDQLQMRVETMLQRSGLMLVIDEAHFCWPQSERSKAAPQIIDWIDTALVNRGVPVALVTTPQFIFSMQRVEERTGWNSGQFQRRIKRVTRLPEKPELADLQLIASRMLPKAQGSVVKLLVGFAGAQKRHHLDSLTDAVKEAQELARAEGRDVPTFADAKAAIDAVLVPNVLAKQSIFTQGKRARKGMGLPTPELADAPLREAGKPVANRLQGVRGSVAAEEDLPSRHPQNERVIATEV